MVSVEGAGVVVSSFAGSFSGEGSSVVPPQATRLSIMAAAIRKVTNFFICSLLFVFLAHSVLLPVFILTKNKTLKNRNLLRFLC
jgi:hypothetical protein